MPICVDKLKRDKTFSTANLLNFSKKKDAFAWMIVDKLNGYRTDFYYSE